MKMLRFVTYPLSVLPLLLFLGCEVDTPSDVQRSVGANFTGFYKNDQGGAIVSKNTGGAINTLDLRQNGDRLEAIDNHGLIFKGSIGAFNQGVASFDLTGPTTAGNQGIISGTLTASGSTSTGSVGATTGTMQGTWIEDNLFSTVRAVATIPGVSIGGGGGGGGGGDAVSIDPATATVGLLNSQAFTAAGGTGTISWTFVSGGGSGSLSTTSGAQTTFTRTSSGQVIIRAADSLGRSDTATIN